MNSLTVFWINNITYFLFIFWGLFSIYNLYKYKKANPYIIQLIPSVFTTLGIFGTFIGVAYGLWVFDVKDITKSIPNLLEGMKTAFITSIIGIALSFISSLVIAELNKRKEEEVPPPPTSEFEALKQLIQVIEKNHIENIKHTQDLKSSLITEIKLQQDLHNTANEVLTNNHLEGVNLLTQIVENSQQNTKEIQSLQKQQQLQNKSINENAKAIIETLNTNHIATSKKFDEFGDLLAKNNTEALVNAMQRVIVDFNEKMNQLIQRLVKENFHELNNSVKQLNTWQMENKEHIEKLTAQFKNVSSNLQIASDLIKLIAENTNKLTNEESLLVQLIQELQSVMIEDTKFQEMSSKIATTVATLENTTNAFDETTSKLNQWIKGERNLKEAVTVLISRLEEIEKIKDINGEFWTNTKKQMEQGVSLVAKANQQLANDVKVINSEFYKRLNDTLQSLDTLIQQFILNSKKN